MVWKHDSQSPVPSSGCNAEENYHSSMRSQRAIQRMPRDQWQSTYQSRWGEGLQLPHRRRAEWKREGNEKRKPERHRWVFY